MSLTLRQDEVLTAIKDYWNKNDKSPTLNELCALINTSSPGGLINMLKTLERKKRITRTTGNRGIFLIERCPNCGAKMKNN